MYAPPPGDAEGKMNARSILPTCSWSGWRATWVISTGAEGHNDNVIQESWPVAWSAPAARRLRFRDMTWTLACTAGGGCFSRVGKLAAAGRALRSSVSRCNCGSDGHHRARPVVRRSGNASFASDIFATCLLQPSVSNIILIKHPFVHTILFEWFKFAG